MDLTLFSFVFLQGIVMFFAPCAVAMLPAYVGRLIARGAKTQSSFGLLRHALFLSALILSGLVMVFGLAAGLIFLFAELVKGIIPWIVIVMGFALLVLGVASLFGRGLKLNFTINAQGRGEKSEAFLFGVAYALGALGCLFPLFLSVITLSISAGNLFEGGLLFGAYFLGVSSLLVTVIILTAFARNWLNTTLRKILPYIERFSGLLLIAAGLYLIYYQSVLVF